MKKVPFYILILLVSFGTVSAILFTPALPSIRDFFGVSIAKAQLAITAYLLGYAFGQLPYGPIANRFGRKKALYIGITAAIIGSVLCALSAPLHSFSLLICARVLQALGASAGLKVSFTMIADTYEGDKATKMLARITMAFAIMPGIGVAIGGWLTEWLGWQSCFYFLVLFGFFMFWLSMRLPETAKTLDPHALNLKNVVKGYAIKLKNRKLILNSLIVGMGTACLYIFASKAPFIGITLIGLSPEEFGNMNLLPSLGMFTGSILATFLTGRLHIGQQQLMGILATFAVSSAMFIFFAIPLVNMWTLFLPMCCFCIVEVQSRATSTSLALGSAQNKSNASAVLNFLNIGTAVVAVFLSQWIFPLSPILLPLSFVVLFSIALMLRSRQPRIV